MTPQEEKWIPASFLLEALKVQHILEQLMMSKNASVDIMWLDSWFKKRRQQAEQSTQFLNTQQIKYLAFNLQQKANNAYLILHFGLISGLLEMLYTFYDLVDGFIRSFSGVVTHHHDGLGFATFLMFGSVGFIGLAFSQCSPYAISYIAGTRNLDYVGLLLDGFSFFALGSRARSAVQASLMDLLPKLTPEDIRSLSNRQKRCLKAIFEMAIDDPELATSALIAVANLRYMPAKESIRKIVINPKLKSAHSGELDPFYIAAQTALTALEIQED